MRVGDVVRLKAGGEPMVVVEVVRGCDGTSGDGAGLRCAWVADDHQVAEAWVSESSVALVMAARSPTSALSTPGRRVR